MSPFISIVAVALLGTQRIGRPEVNRKHVDPNEFILFGTVEQWNNRPSELMLSHHIHGSGVGGSRGVCGLRVERRDLAKAYDLLVRDCKRNHYWLAIRGPGGVLETFGKKK